MINKKSSKFFLQQAWKVKSALYNYDFLLFISFLLFLLFIVNEKKKNSLNRTL
jgi:hypothetical protein